MLWRLCLIVCSRPSGQNFYLIFVTCKKTTFARVSHQLPFLFSFRTRELSPSSLALSVTTFGEITSPFSDECSTLEETVFFYLWRIWCHYVVVVGREKESTRQGEKKTDESLQLLLEEFEGPLRDFAVGRCLLFRLWRDGRRTRVFLWPGKHSPIAPLVFSA